MADSGEQPENSIGMAGFERALDDISTFIDNASEEEKQEALKLLKHSALFGWLEDLQAEERRKHARKLCSIDINGATWRGPFDGMVQNISPGGMFIETDTTLSPREEITVSFFFANTPEPIRVVSEVVWTPRKGIGVRFISPLSIELQQVIASL